MTLWLFTFAGLVLLPACSTLPPMPPEKTPPRAAAPEPARHARPLAPATRPADLARFHAINRLTWGASVSAMAQAVGKDFNTLLDQQLAPARPLCQRPCRRRSMPSP